MNILRRLSLSRLLLLCGVVVAVGVSATALASAVGSGPTPPLKPLALAVHDALRSPSVEGLSATVKLTDHLLEGANLASGDGEASQLSSSPLLSGASGRLWIAKDGRVRLELQSEKGDTQILYDGHTVSLYDGSTNTLYRYTIPAHAGGASAADGSGGGTAADHHEPPTVAKIEEAISHLQRHANVSGATPTDVAGQAAYTVRISPNEGGSLFGRAELSWDAVHGVPLRAAIYSSTGPAPVIELAASEVSYGPVADSVLNFTPPPGAKIEEVSTPGQDSAKQPAPSAGAHSHPKVTTQGHGVAGIAVIESAIQPGGKRPPANLPAGLPKVNINGVSATELATSLGTLLSFERSGVRYLLAGSVTPAAIEAVARGL
ncbi:MAG: outer membrane lipoprotein carrier protein LolA [Solirubrobacterales bacterium]